MQSNLPTSDNQLKFIGPSVLRLPDRITGYDLFKTLALVFMVVDHIGYFFLPEVIWLRIIGRLSVPFWFYLIGYAKSRNVPYIWWIGAGVLALAAGVSGDPFLPLSILVTLGLSRLLIDAIAIRAFRKKETLAGMFLLLFFISFHTAAIFEYGTIGLLFALWGYTHRNKEWVRERFSLQALFVFQAAVCLGYIFQQFAFMPRGEGIHFIFLCAAMVLIASIFYGFSRYEFDMERWSGLNIFFPILKITGRYTLAFYVLHLIIFRLLAVIFFPERFQLFNFQITPPSFAVFF